MRHRRGARFWIAVVTALLLVVAAACTSDSGVSEEEYEAVQADLAQAEADLAAAEGQVSTAGVTSQQVVVTGQLAPAIEPAVQVGADGWSDRKSVV